MEKNLTGPTSPYSAHQEIIPRGPHIPFTRVRVYQPRTRSVGPTWLPLPRARTLPHPLIRGTALSGASFSTGRRAGDRGFHGGRCT
jgi:hypothetical protein